MNTSGQEPTMNQRIFDLGLPTKTISLYLLCCGLIDAGVTLSTKNIMDRWNGSDDEFKKGVSELKNRNILEQILSGGEDQEVFKVKDVHGWR
jgi:hypothetical protein